MPLAFCRSSLLIASVAAYSGAIAGDKAKEVRMDYSVLQAGAYLERDTEMAGVPVVGVAFDSDESFADAQFAMLETFPSLQRISFGERISLAGLRRLARLSTLRELSLSGFAVTSAHIEALSKLEGITNLTLSRCDLRGLDLESLSILRTLRRLDVSHSRIDGSFVRALAKCTELEELNLSSTSIKDAEYRTLPDFPKLKRLSLRNVSLTAC